MLVGIEGRKKAMMKRISAVEMWEMNQRDVLSSLKRLFLIKKM